MDSSGQLIRVAIVEDIETTRDALSVLISSSRGFVCVAGCQSAEEALEILPKIKPQVVLMDIQLSGEMDGIKCICRLRDTSPGTQIVMLTVFEDHDRIFQSLAAGAVGYLVKKTPPEELLEAIKDAHRGGSPMTSQIARRVVEHFRNGGKGFSNHLQSDLDRLQLDRLSPRENEILSLLSQGYLYKEIAHRLDISIGTVRVHIRRIYEKLHVHSRTDATRMFLGRS